MTFLYPPTFTDGDVLTRANLDIFRRNDEWLSGVADGWRTINRGEARGFIGDEGSLTIWDGWHLLRSDAKTLCYYIFADDGSGSRTVTTKLYYDNVLIDQISTTGGYQSKSGTSDLSAKSPGLYRVHCTLERTGIPGGQGGLRCPYTRYTGALSWTTPPTITDGLLSSAAHLNAWKDNDRYLNDQVHPNPNFSGQQMQYLASEGERVLWVGWDRFHPDHYRMQHRTKISVTTGGNKVRLYYDWNGTYEQYKDITTQGESSGYWDLSSPGNYTKGSYYCVCAKMMREGTDQSIMNCQYLFMCAPAKDSSYTVMGLFSPGQWVYGNTGGQTTRLALLSSNDSSIRDRLIWDDVTNGRMDHAVRSPEYEELGGTAYGDFAALRRFSLLYYRVKDATLYYGTDGEESLEDYDANNPYRILDLNSIDLPIGMTYRIDGDLEFAMEL